MCGNVRLVLIAVMVVLVNTTFVVEGSTMKNASPAPLFKDPATSMEMIYVKGGCYQMGDIFGDGESEEKPAHEVCVDDFYIGKYEVTQGQWKKIMGTNPSFDSGCKGDDTCPVDCVSWNDAQEFISRLNKKSTGNKYRLPTEAEWEYAARSGGKSERYSGGNDVDSVAWYAENSGKKNHPVGAKASNGLGIYDMSGNVWEWTSDWYGSGYYSNSPRTNPAGPDKPAGLYSDRVIRGGCKTGEAANQRTFRRTAHEPDYRADKIGFRLLRTL
jgi:formylglycine-generating enzyme required for sulfatase activity